VDERLERFFDVVAPALAGDMARVQYVDLRYTNGFAVGWRPAADGAYAATTPPSDRG
jgi:cell division protein FtsQ